VTKPEAALAVPEPVPVAPEAAGEPPSHEDVRRWLGEQVASLRADCARYRAAGNAPALASATRSLTAATALLERVTPEPPAQAEGVFIKKGELEALAEEGRKRLTALVNDLFREPNE
jgi:hypothetical protein